MVVMATVDIAENHLQAKWGGEETWGRAVGWAQGWVTTAWGGGGILVVELVMLASANLCGHVPGARPGALARKPPEPSRRLREVVQLLPHPAAEKAEAWSG